MFGFAGFLMWHDAFGQNTRYTLNNTTINTITIVVFLWNYHSWCVTMLQRQTKPWTFAPGLQEVLHSLWPTNLLSLCAPTAVTTVSLSACCSRWLLSINFLCHLYGFYLFVCSLVWNGAWALLRWMDYNSTATTHQSWKFDFLNLIQLLLSYYGSALSRSMSF